jgi:hypothetical protein
MKHSLLKLDKSIQSFTCGRGPRGCYCLTLNPNDEGFAYHVADFIRYENANGRKVRFKPRSFDPSHALQSIPENSSVLRPNDSPCSQYTAQR